MEATELIKEYASKIQTIDEQIQDLKESKKDILKDARDEGLNTTLLNKAISQIRREKKNPNEKAELELYLDVVQPVIDPLS